MDQMLCVIWLFATFGDETKLSVRITRFGWNRKAFEGNFWQEKYLMH